MHLNTISSLEDRLSLSEEHMNQMVEAAVQDMKSKLRHQMVLNTNIWLVLEYLCAVLYILMYLK